MKSSFVEQNAAAWREIGVAAIVYGAVVLAAAGVAQLVWGGVAMVGPFIWAETMAALGVAAVMVAPGVVYRCRRQRLPVMVELVIALLALVGMGVFLVIAGAGVLVVTGSYRGVEKWLPEIEDRNAYQLSALQEAVSALELSRPVHERALELLETVEDRGLLGNRPFNEMLGGIVYIAAREHATPRTIGEVAAVVGADKKEVGKAYRYIGRNTGVRIVPPEPEQFLGRAADRLALSDDVVRQAQRLIQDARDRDMLSGKSPHGVAAAAMYLAAQLDGEDRSLRDVADTFSVTTVTIRDRSREFVDVLNLPDVLEFSPESGAA